MAEVDFGNQITQQHSLAEKSTINDKGGLYKQQENKQTNNRVSQKPLYVESCDTFLG